jgi:hypothetical protein
MKKNFVLLAPLFLSLAAHADYGQCTYANQTLDHVQCFGMATLTHTNVENQVEVFGPLTMTNSTATQVKVNGSLNMDNSNVTSSLTIYGFLNASNTMVGGLVNVYSNELTLSQVQFQGGLVVHSQNETPKVTLTNHSVLSNITFVGKPGVVILQNQDATPTVTNGEVRSN